MPLHSSTFEIRQEAVCKLHSGERRQGSRVIWPEWADYWFGQSTCWHQGYAHIVATTPNVPGKIPRKKTPEHKVHPRPCWDLVLGAMAPGLLVDVWSRHLESVPVELQSCPATDHGVHVSISVPHDTGAFSGENSIFMRMNKLFLFCTFALFTFCSLLHLLQANAKMTHHMCSFLPAGRGKDR